MGKIHKTLYVDKFTVLRFEWVAKILKMKHGELFEIIVEEYYNNHKELFDEIFLSEALIEQKVYSLKQKQTEGYTKTTEQINNKTEAV